MGRVQCLVEGTEYIIWRIGSWFIKYKQGRRYLIKRSGKERTLQCSGEWDMKLVQEGREVTKKETGPTSKRRKQRGK